MLGAKISMRQPSLINGTPRRDTYGTLDGVLPGVEVTLADNEAADEQREEGNKTDLPAIRVSIRYRRCKDGQ